MSAPGGPVAPTAEYVRRRRRGTGSSTIFPRKRKTTPLVRRAVFTMLVCASLGLITATYRGGVMVHSLQMSTMGVFAPIERGLTRAWDPIASAWNWTSRLTSATSRVDDLERENAELKMMQHVAEENADEVRDLRRLLGLHDKAIFPSGYKDVYGRVIARVPGAVDRTIVIGLGTDDGVRQNDPVMSDKGLIGRVLTVTHNSARVGLIIDSSTAVSAVVSGTTASGVLQSVSNESSPVLQLQYVSTSADVERDALVVTSGFRNGDLSSFFPPGIPIGYVSSVGNSPADLDKTVQVTPFADFDRIDEVVVLIAKTTPIAYEMPAAVTKSTSELTTPERADPVIKHHKKKSATDDKDTSSTKATKPTDGAAAG